MVTTNILLAAIVMLLGVLVLFNSGNPTPNATRELFQILEDIKNKIK